MFKSPRDSCLFEAEKIGLELVYDPPALANRCFYRCIARCLSLKEDDLIDMVGKSMLEEQFLPVKNEVRANLFFNCYFAHANLQTTLYNMAVELSLEQMLFYTISYTFNLHCVGKKSMEFK